MTKAQIHRLVEIAREEGSIETRFHFVCSCGALGPDHGAQSYLAAELAQEWAEADHKLHSEGRSPNEATDHSANPMGKPKKRERYRHPVLRGIWTVRSAGDKQIILDSNIPWLKPTVLPTSSWPGKWERVP